MKVVDERGIADILKKTIMRRLDVDVRIREEKTPHLDLVADMTMRMKNLQDEDEMMIAWIEVTNLMVVDGGDMKMIMMTHLADQIER